MMGKRRRFWAEMHNRWREIFQEYGAECLVIFFPMHDDLISAHLPIFLRQKLNTKILNSQYWNAHHQRHTLSRRLETTGGGRVSIQDHLAPMSAHYVVGWLLWGGWLKIFAMYKHAGAKKECSFLVGALAKIDFVFLSSAWDRKDSKICGILMVEIWKPGKGLALPRL